jgi:exodeoxyribonuclease VII small subunit
MPKSPPPPSAGAPEPAFEQRLEQLESIVRQLESAGLPLEEALKLFEQGMQLSEDCRKELETAEARVEVLLKKGQSVEPAPFGEDEP